MNKKGFTLIELLVVITVVGVLSTALLAVLNPLEQIKKSRDAQRKNDLSQIKKVLEAYNIDHGSYPQTLTFGGALEPYIKAIPNDPSKNQEYRYESVDNGEGYRIYAKLENCNDSQKISEATCDDYYTYSVVSPNLTVIAYTGPTPTATSGGGPVALFTEQTTNTPTPTPITTYPTTTTSYSSPTPSPSPLPSTTPSPTCTLTSASWELPSGLAGNTVIKQMPVGLRVNGTGPCTDKQVTFAIWEADTDITTPLDTLFRDAVATNPTSRIFASEETTVISYWFAEYQQDGFGGINDPPEYYFVASLSDNSSSVVSPYPLLSVRESAPPGQINVFLDDGRGGGVAGNQIKDGDEPGVPGATVVISSESLQDNITLITDIDGIATTDRISFESYTIDVRKPSDSGVIGTNAVRTFSGSPIYIAMGRNFSIFPVTVKIDDNENGISDANDTPVANARITLVGFANTVARTDSHGSARFTGSNSYTPGSDYTISLDLAELQNSRPGYTNVTPLSYTFTYWDGRNRAFDFLLRPTEAHLSTGLYKHVFVTGSSFNSDFQSGGPGINGFQGADNICKRLADGSSLVHIQNKTWRAWVGWTDQESRGLSLFNWLGEYRLVDGQTIVALDWNDLLDGYLRNPINKTETGEIKNTASTYVWTGIEAHGGPGNNCGNWTSRSEGTALVGQYEIAYDGKWTNSRSSSCAETLPLYCFEQNDYPLKIFSYSVGEDTSAPFVTTYSGQAALIIGTNSFALDRCEWHNRDFTFGTGLNCEITRPTNAQGYATCYAASPKGTNNKFVSCRDASGTIDTIQVTYTVD